MSVQTLTTLQASVDKIRAFSGRDIKISSTIRPDPKWFIKRDERLKAAMYFYNNRKSKGVSRMAWRWASLVSMALFPKIAQRKMDLKTAKDFRAIWKSSQETWVSSHIDMAASIKKDSENRVFKVTVPVAIAITSSFPVGFAGLAFAMTGRKDALGDEFIKTTFDEYARDIQAGGETKVYHSKNWEVTPSIDQNELTQARAANASISFKKIASYTAAFLHLDFSQREAEFLCNSPWIEIRPLDFYGVINAWVEGQFGHRARTAAFSLPMSKIVKSTEGVQATPRISADGVSIDHTGTYWAFPSSLNNIDGYEESAMAALSQDDGSVSAVTPDFKRRQPPASMPVYMDWVNLKFAYTTTTGKLEIAELDRTQASNITHVRKLLDKPVGSDLITELVRVAINLCDQTNNWHGSRFTQQDFLLEMETINKRYDQYGSLMVTPFKAIYDFSRSFAGEAKICMQLIEIFKDNERLIRDNPANAYARYSVPTVLQFQGGVSLFNKYIKSYADVVDQDDTKRSAYTNQGVDPKFVMPAVPYAKEDPDTPRGMLPHQFKLQNILRDIPETAFLDVQAGGGKTSVILIETLKLMERDERFLGLIMCPAHLVAQYAKEFAYFTANNINVIPVTGYTIRRHGFDKLKSMIVASPRNTVVVTDFNVITNKKLTLNYGVTSIEIFPVIDFLRQFSFSYVAVDESHKLKNGSARNSAASKVIIETPIKRLASGTMVSNSMIDLVRQTALVDPSVFGSVSDFINEYALEVQGSKVIKWKKGAEAAVRARLKQHIVIADAKRKEWAAMLPEPKEVFHIDPCALSENQMRLYLNILQQIQDEVLKAAQTDKSLAKMLNRMNGTPDTPADGEEDADEEMDMDDLARMLRPYIARLEMFVDAPGLDMLGAKVLKGDDLVSPKARHVATLCRQHIESNTPGKILVFTSYTNSAVSVYENLPPDLKAQAILYTAGNKLEDAAEFERNPGKKIMIGVEFSMNTGVNLQFCSRLIRMDAVWTPGELEQGNSRIGRPNVKEREGRPFVYYDWLISNGTVDVTKASYLLAKTISAGKFYEAGNPRFDNIEVPKLLKMRLDTIFQYNDVETTLLDYFRSYQEFQQMTELERREFREQNADSLFTEDGRIKMEFLKHAETPSGSVAMHDAVYTPGLEVSGFELLGLIRYDTFMNIDASELEETEDDEAGGEEEDEDVDVDVVVDPKDIAKAARIARIKAERERGIGLRAHCDMGDGDIVKIGNKFVWLSIKGQRVKCAKLATFVFADGAKKLKSDVRTTLLQRTSTLKIDNPAPTVKVVDEETPKQRRKREVEEEMERQKEDESVEMQLEFTVVNDYLGVRLLNHDDERAVKVAQGMGFIHPPTYFAAHIRNPKHLQQFFVGLKEKGFEVPKENSRACYLAWDHFRTNRTSTFYGFSTKNEIKNFYRMQVKPDADVKTVRPYPLIQDGLLYIALPKTGHPGSMQAIRRNPVPGLKWFAFDSDVEMVNFTATKPAASALIKNLLAEGVVITNIKELKKQFQSLKIANPKREEE